MCTPEQHSLLWPEETYLKNFCKACKHNDHIIVVHCKVAINCLSDNVIHLSNYVSEEIKVQPSYNIYTQLHPYCHMIRFWSDLIGIHDLWTMKFVYFYSLFIYLFTILFWSNNPTESAIQ